jgi:amino acid adenylation domain-containing protein
LTGATAKAARNNEHSVADSDATRNAYPPENTVADLFAAQAARTPDACAVASGAAQMSYSQLDAASTRLARELIARRLGPGHRVGVMLERSAELVVALLAVLKAGSAFIPLDPAYPQERLTFTAGNARLSAVVTRSTISEAVGLDVPLVSIDDDAAAIAAHSDEPIDTEVQPHGLAYMIYTSGSTGRPKGVQIEHRAMVNFLWATATSSGFGIDANDVLMAVTTIAFDMAILEMFLPLITGARLVVADEAEIVDTAALLRLLQRSKATIMQATPITWQLLIDAGWNGDPALKVITGGEALSRKLANLLLSRGASVWNGYGPTETTVYSSFSRVPTGTAAVPLGPPIANTQFYVVESDGSVCEPGTPGELVIGGDGVARGYFERPDLTHERFLPDTYRNAPDGHVYRTGDVVRLRDDGWFDYLGRSDHQVKLRGFRIELGEIESTLLRRADVKDAAVVVHGADAADKALYAYVVPQELATTNAAWSAAMRAWLSASLPHYMVPARIFTLDALPRTPNNKVDRNALKPPEHSAIAAPAQAMANPTETALAELIVNLLGTDVTVKRDDDIFALGFHSLMAARLVIGIAKTLSAQIPVRAIFDNPTIPADIAALDVAQPIVTFSPGGTRRPFIYFHSDVLVGGTYCRRLADLIGPDQPIHAISPHGTAGLPSFQTVEAMARDFLPRIRNIQPAGPYRLGGFCAGGYVAYEVARRLCAQGEVVERLVLINAPAPLPKTRIDASLLIRAIGGNAHISPNLRESLSHNVARLAQTLDAGPRSVAGFVATRLRALAARAKRVQHSAHAEARAGRVEDHAFAKRSGTPETENYFSQVVATLTFHPDPYGGEIDLVWSVDHAATYGDPTIGWNTLAKTVRITPMAGGHVSPLHDRIDDLGDILRGLLC